MRVNGNLLNYNTMYQTRGIKENAASQSFAEEMKEAEEMKKAEETEKAEKTKDEEKVQEESKSDSEIITRPDGSKVLMITNQIGGMQTVTSIKLSEANPFQNDYKELSDFSDKTKAVD